MRLSSGNPVTCLEQWVVYRMTTEVSEPSTYRPLRITIVTGPFFPLPPSPCGAVEHLWLGSAREFTRKGHRVTMVSRLHAGLACDEQLDGIHHVRLPGFRQSGSIVRDLIKDFFYSCRALRALTPADIIVTNVFWLPFLLGLGVFRRGAVVVNMERFPKGQTRLYLRSARIVVPSQAIRYAVVRQCPRANDITRVIPNPINTDVFTPPRGQRFQGTDRVIIYTGRVHPEKGVHLLVEAFKRLFQRSSTLRLRIIGPRKIDRGGGGEAYINTLRGLSRGLPVEFVDPIDDRHSLAAVLQAADIYCYPSIAEKGESFGVAPLEAMATGLAPVVSALDCFRDFIEDGRTGCVFDHKGSKPVQALADVLQQFLDDPQWAQQMGVQAAQKAKEFGYSRVADLYLNDFQSILTQ